MLNTYKGYSGMGNPLDNLDDLEILPVQDSPNCLFCGSHHCDSREIPFTKDSLIYCEECNHKFVCKC